MTETRTPDVWWSPSTVRAYSHVAEGGPFAEHKIPPRGAASWTVRELPADAVRLVPELAADPATILAAWYKIVELVGRAGTSPASVVDRVAYLAEQADQVPDTGQARSEPIPLRFAWTELLGDELSARGIPLRMLAKPLGLSVAEVEDLIAGQRELTGVLAARIGQFLGTSTRLWLNLAAQGPAGDTVQAPDVAALLRFAAAGRREYATNASADQAAALESAAATFDQAARIASGDVNSLRFAVPSWRWDEADALLGTDAAAPLTGRPLAGDPGLPLSALFDNRDPHQDEMRAGTDTAEPGPVYVKPDEELPHA